MNSSVKFTKTAEHTPSGDYKPTLIDAQKEATQIRLLQVCPKIIDTNLQLKGRGISTFGNGRYTVTDTAWEKLKQQYTWAPDF